MRRRGAAAAAVIVVAAAVLAGCNDSGGSHDDGPAWGDRAATPTVQAPEHSGVGAGGHGEP